MKNIEYKEIEGISDPIQRLQVLATLWTRVATGIELQETKPSELGMKSPSDPWNKANEDLIKIAEKNPREAMRMAQGLINLPPAEDDAQKKVNQWMVTSGLMILGLDEMKDETANFLNTDSGSNKLIENLIRMMNVDVSGLTTSHYYDGNPVGYSAVQSVYIGLGLRDLPGRQSQRLYQAAFKRAQDPDLQMAYGIVSIFSDCTYLTSRF